MQSLVIWYIQIFAVQKSIVLHPKCDFKSDEEKNKRSLSVNFSHTLLETVGETPHLERKLPIRMPEKLHFTNEQTYS